MRGFLIRRIAGFLHLVIRIMPAGPCAAPSQSGAEAPSRTKALLTLLLAFALCAAAPAGGSARESEAEPRLVFAHYMVCCPYPGLDGGVDAFRDEIARAMRAGIDGFVLNCGAWSAEEKYLRVADKLFAAADSFGGAFKLMFSADFATKLSDADAADMVARFRHRVSHYRYRGRPALATYGGTGARIDAIRERARAAGFDPFVFANVKTLSDRALPGRQIETPTDGVIEGIVAENRRLDGHFYFGAAGSPEEIADAVRGFGRRWREAGVAFMAPVTPFYRGHGPNNRLFDGRGFEGLARQWEAAIESGADLVQIVTWNDWGESSYVFPFGGPDAEAVWKGHWGLIRAHDGFLDASRYYIDWFKEGRPPEARTETLSYAYIPHLKSLLPSGSGIGERAPRRAETLEDRFYLFSNLSAEAVVTLRNGGRTSEVRLPAGLHQASIELAPGPVDIEAGGSGWRSLRRALPPVDPDDRRGSYNYLAGSLRLARREAADDR